MQLFINVHSFGMLLKCNYVLQSKHPEELESSEDDEDEDDEPEMNGHSDKDETNKNQPQEPEPPPKAEDPSENKCKFCRKIFHNEPMLRSHLRVISNAVATQSVRLGRIKNTFYVCSKNMRMN